jgi:cell division protein FtsB
MIRDLLRLFFRAGGGEDDSFVSHIKSSWAEPLKTVSNQVGSFDLRRENFRLTREVKRKLTEKLRLVKPSFKLGRIPSPEDGLRAVVQRAPQAEALAASWIERAGVERMRPLLMRLYNLRRRIATVVVVVLAAMLFVHVMLGANGMVVYRQKRGEYEALKKQIERVQQENDRHTQSIQGLKSDAQAIEKEAREQLGYAKPGEYIYVAPPPAKPATPPANRSAQK